MKVARCVRQHRCLDNAPYALLVLSALGRQRVRPARLGFVAAGLAFPLELDVNDVLTG